MGITDLTGATPVYYVPVKDATGSIVQLLDTSGNVVADYHYDAWGVRTANGPAAGACPFGFAGMLIDPTMGLYYDNARWYSAPQGRFLTRDPSGESGGLNLYPYCANDPVNKADPTGRAGEPVSASSQSCLQCHTAASLATTSQSPHVPLKPAGTAAGADVGAWLQSLPLAGSPSPAAPQPAGAIPGLYRNVFSVYGFANGANGIRGNGTISAEALVMAGRSLGANVKVIPWGGSHSDVDAYVLLGRSLAAKERSESGSLSAISTSSDGTRRFVCPATMVGTRRHWPSWRRPRTL